jgi:ornithine cyclodeaminase/alanine dehydrogenase-like protein (mu-crystallin family)
MDEKKVEILFLNKSEVESLITVKDAVNAAEQAYRALGEGQVVQEHIIMPMNDEATNIINSMPCYVKSLNLSGIKWVKVYYRRKSGDDLPLVWGAVIILNHPENGLPYAIMDGTAITNMRTAGGHAVVAAKYLAKKDSRTMAIIGCGAEARTGLRSFMNHFSLELVKVYDIKPDVMSAFKEEMDKEFGVQIMSVFSAKEAVQGADIVLIVTSARKPVVLEPWIERGCFVAGMLAFRDLDPMLSLKADKWVLGTHEGDNKLIFERPGMPAPKELSGKNVYADMGEIVTGTKPGRQNDKERIVYTHLGMGAHDVILGYTAYTRAVKQGKGIKIYL